MLKTLLGTAALFFAAPALSQPAPAADPHAGHAEHNMPRPAQNAETGAQQQQHSGHGGQGGGHGQHMMNCCKNCSGEDRQESREMPCCDKQRDGAPDGTVDHSQHGN